MLDSEKTYKIVKLEANNIMRLSAVEITPDGSLICLGGENEQGKSSVITTIEMVLFGQDYIPPMPIRRGQTKANGIVDLGDIIVERTFSAKGTNLTIKGKDGTKINGPQTLLDSLRNRAFDPLAFKSLKPKEQAETLKKLVGIDTTKFEKLRQTAFDQRTVVNRRVKELEATFKQSVKHDDAPKEEVSVAELLVERDRRAEINDDNRLTRNAASRVSSVVTEIANELLELKRQMEERLEALATAETEAKELQKALPKLVDLDIGEITSKMATVEETNRKVRANADHAKKKAELKSESDRADKLTAEIEKADADKSAMITNAEFPIEGLGFDEDGVTFGGIPSSQWSGSQALKISASIGFAMNPKLKVLLVKNGPYVDEKSLKDLAEIASEHNGQIWLEHGGTGAECSLIIEDGHVKE